MKKMAVCILVSHVLIGILLCQNSFAQGTQIVISGKVVDKGSQESLPYATIRIKDEPIGVVSNQFGEFTFKVSERYLSDTLIVSTMGYRTFKQVLNHIENRDNLLIELSLKTTMLKEVVIINKKLSPKEIIEKVILNIKFNYPQEPYLLEGFYRDFKKENEKYIALLEAAVSIYDKGYVMPPRHAGQLKEDVYLIEIRKSKTVDYKAKIYEVLNVLYEMLLSNDVKYGGGDRLTFDLRRTKHELEKFIYLNNQPVYVIKTEYPWMSHIFIDAQSFAVLEIEMDARWEGTHKNEWKMNDSIMNRTPYIKKTLRFKKYEGKYFLEYMNYSWRIEGFKNGSEKTLFTSDFYQELLVNNIITKNVQKPARENKMSATKILELQAKPYNRDFWQSYNVIRESPLDNRIIKDLEEGGSLEKQFSKNGSQKTEEKVTKGAKKN